MDVGCIPRQLLVRRLETGKCTAGGQKLRWADIVTKDLKRCKIDKDWRKVAQDTAHWNEWNAIIENRVIELNTEAEELEKLQKDELKERRERMFIEAQMELQCTEPGCGFRAQSKAGLVNHRRQKHRAAALETLPCQHCGG